MFRDRNYFQDISGLVYRIVGDHHDDFVVSYVKYHPHPDGDRILGGRPYLPSPRVSRSFELLSGVANRVRNCPSLGTTVTGCSKSEIAEVYDARTYLARRLYDKLTGTRRSLERLITKLSQANIPIDSLGITGSMLVGTDNDNSDIDLVVYGIAHLEELKTVFKTHVAQYVGPLEHSLLERRKKHMPSIPDDILLLQESRKIQGVWEGKHVNVQPIRITPGVSRQYVDLGDVTVVSVVSNDEESFYAPAEYGVSQSQILDAGVRIPPERISHIVSFVGAYSQVARAGDPVLAQGALLRYETESGPFYVVSIDPWSRGFNNKLQLLRSHVSL